MNQLKLSLFAFVLVFISIAMAHGDDIHLNKLNYCNVTKITMNDYEPAVFETTNNLLRKASEKPIYCGEKIIVHGRVLDQNCVPVSDAIVYAWQANCNGKYPYQPLKTIIDKELINVDPNITFTGNGTATTNNKGEFHFVTVYPPAMHEKPSHVNVRIEHHRLGSLQTSLVLRGKKVNNPEADPELGSIADVAAEHDINIYDFKIVLLGSGLKEY